MARAKRKKFFEVDIPIIKKKTSLIAYEPKQLDGRVISYDLTRMLKGKNMILQLNVKIENDKITAVPKKTTVLQYFIKRMIRKGTDNVEDSFSTKTKDAIVRIKPFLVTRRKVSRAVRKALRNRAREELVSYSKAKTSEEIFKDILSNRIQKELSLKLKKIYPLSLCEIRIFKIEKEIKNTETNPEE